MAFQIHQECIGCGACLRACPAGAIAGEKKALHRIDPRLCIRCGACGRVCPSEAVSDDQGTRIPRIPRKNWERPRIIEEACLACENCVGVCPTGALAMAGEDLPQGQNRAVLARPEACVSCRWCLDNCQFDAIVMEAAQ